TARLSRAASSSSAGIAFSAMLETCRLSTPKATTRWPRRASVSVIALPMPNVPPVTITDGAGTALLRRRGSRVRTGLAHALAPRAVIHVRAPRAVERAGVLLGDLPAHHAGDEVVGFRQVERLLIVERIAARDRADAGIGGV